jgi:hypothetical protein
MNNISKEIRAKLKRLSPYIGTHIPDSVKIMRDGLWAPSEVPEKAGWNWDDGSGFYQCELLLCDLDVDDVVDPAGYVAIRPLKAGNYALVFVVDPEWHPDNLIFPTIEEAKRYLDTLLAADTPEIPLEET